MSHLLITTIVILLMSSFCTVELKAETIKNNPEDKSIELGLIAYRKYIHYYKESREKSIYSFLKSLFPAIKRVPEDVEIFLPENTAKLAKYKRIWIPGYAVLFSRKMYAGMNRFVNEGGLLITSQTLPTFDIDENYKSGYEQDFFYRNKESDNPLLKIYGKSSAVFIEIKALEKNPITSGLELNEWLPLSPSGGYHVTGANSANIIMKGRAKTKKLAKEYQPFLVYKQQGKGAMVYIASLTPDQSIRKIVKNLLSENTLNWLCKANR